MCPLQVAARLAAFGVLGWMATPPSRGAELPLPFQGPVLDKNFPVLSALMKSPEAREALRSDPVLADLTARRSAGPIPSTSSERSEAGVPPLMGYRWADADIARARGVSGV